MQESISRETGLGESLTSFLNHFEPFTMNEALQNSQTSQDASFCGHELKPLQAYQTSDIQNDPMHCLKGGFWAANPEGDLPNKSPLCCSGPGFGLPILLCVQQNFFKKPEIPQMWAACWLYQQSLHPYIDENYLIKSPGLPQHISPPEKYAFKMGM